MQSQPHGFDGSQFFRMGVLPSRRSAKRGLSKAGLSANRECRSRLNLRQKPLLVWQPNQESRSAWMAKALGVTKSLLNDCGKPSSTTSLNMYESDRQPLN